MYVVEYKWGKGVKGGNEEESCKSNSLTHSLTFTRGGE